MSYLINLFSSPETLLNKINADPTLKEAETDKFIGELEKIHKSYNLQITIEDYKLDLIADKIFKGEFNVIIAPKNCVINTTENNKVYVGQFVIQEKNLRSEKKYLYFHKYFSDFIQIYVSEYNNLSDIRKDIYILAYKKFIKELKECIIRNNELFNLLYFVNRNKNLKKEAEGIMNISRIYNGEVYNIIINYTDIQSYYNNHKILNDIENIVNSYKELKKENFVDSNEHAYMTPTNQLPNIKSLFGFINRYNSNNNTLKNVFNRYKQLLNYMKTNQINIFEQTNLSANEIKDECYKKAIEQIKKTIDNIQPQTVKGGGIFDIFENKEIYAYMISICIIILVLFLIYLLLFDQCECSKISYTYDN